MHSQAHHHQLSAPCVPSGIKIDLYQVSRALLQPNPEIGNTAGGSLPIPIDMLHTRNTQKLKPLDVTTYRIMTPY